MRQQKLKFYSIAISLIILFSCSIATADLNKTLIDNALVTAVATAKGFGYDITEMGIMIQYNMRPELIYSENNRPVKSGPKYDLIQSLIGKEYLSVYYRPHVHYLDEGICVVVDATDAKTVLGVYQGTKLEIISKNKALDVAVHEINKRDLKIPVEAEIKVYWSIPMWIKVSSDTQNKLENREYWSVVYSPKQGMAGVKRLIFFIDTVTGEIIDIVTGI